MRGADKESAKLLATSPPQDSEADSSETQSEPEKGPAAGWGMACRAIGCCSLVAILTMTVMMCPAFHWEDYYVFRERDYPFGSFLEQLCVPNWRGNSSQQEKEVHWLVVTHWEADPYTQEVIEELRKLGQFAQEVGADRLLLVSKHDDPEGRCALYERSNVTHDGGVGRPVAFECVELPNFGRDLHTASWFADHYFDDLRRLDIEGEQHVRVSFAPHPMGRHGRDACVRHVAQLEGRTAEEFFGLVRSEDLERYRNWSIAPYVVHGRETRLLEPARCPNGSLCGHFEPWFTEWLISYAPRPPCPDVDVGQIWRQKAFHNGVFSTTSRLILRRSRENYSALTRQLHADDGGEAGHFTERAVGVAFGWAGVIGYEGPRTLDDWWMPLHGIPRWTVKLH